MKKFLTLFVSIGFLSLMHGQSLVKNHSFEATQCPIYSPNTEDYINPWTTYFGTPDYYEPNCGDPGSETTTNNSLAFDGEGFVGLYVYGQDGATYRREYLHGELKEPLKKGRHYRVTFYVKPVDINGGTYGINNIGMLLTDSIIDTVPADNVLRYKPQIAAKDPIESTNFWTPICGVIYATGNEKYITLGNFSADPQTAVVPLEGATNPQTAYFLFDNIEIVENDLPELPKDTFICEQGRIDIDIRRPDYSFTLIDEGIEGITTITPGRYYITAPGEYVLNINSPYCSYQDTIRIVGEPCENCKLYIPNAFTPNGDFMNDEFALQSTCADELISYRIQIFDRWGQKVFESIDIDISWDGNNVDKTSTYTYNVQYQYRKLTEVETVTKRGVITLIK